MPDGSTFFESVPMIEMPSESAPATDAGDSPPPSTTIETTPELTASAAEKTEGDASAPDAPTTPPEGDTKPVEAPVAAEGDKKPVAEAKATEGDAPKVDEPVVAAPVALPDSVVAALRTVADQLGITETDPLKITELVQAKRDEYAAAQAAESEAKQKKVAEEAEGKIFQQAVDAHGDVLANAAVTAMAAAGYKLTDDMWTEGTFFIGDDGESVWKDADAVQADYAKRYQAFGATPDMQTKFQNDLTARKGEYAAKQQQFADLVTKYPYSKDILTGLHQNGAEQKFLEVLGGEITRVVDKAHATLNSANATQAAEIETLRAQVSGHAEALAKARQDGLAEGQLAAIELAKGRDLPTTIGVGQPSDGKGPKTYDPNRRTDLSFDQIPLMH